MAVFKALFLCVASLAFAGGCPPTAEKPDEQVYGSFTVIDPYQWLEDGQSSDVQMWTDLQTAYARQALDSLPDREALAAQLELLLAPQTVSLPAFGGTRWFFLSRQGTEPQAQVFVQEGLDSPRRALFGPQQELLCVDWLSPSPDGTLLAVGVQTAGDENTDCVLLRVSDGVEVERIGGKVSEVQWMGDGSGFFYCKLAALDNPYSTQVRYHRLRTDPDSDPLLFEQYKQGPLAKTWGPGICLDPQGRYLALLYWTSTRANDLYLIDLDAWRLTGIAHRRPIAVGRPFKYLPVGFAKGKLLVETTEAAPEGKLTCIALAADGELPLEELVPERRTCPLQEVHVAGERLLLVYLSGATSEVFCYDLAGVLQHRLPLPAYVTAHVRADPHSERAFVECTGFNTAPATYLFQAKQETFVLWHQRACSLDLSHHKVSRVLYPSKDGTPVSMFLVQRGDLSPNSPHPLVIYGYGGFNISLSPFFDPSWALFVERGGILAVPHLRGGGEYGDAWHAMGMREKKQNTFDDCIAAAEWLIQSKRTDSAKLAVAGGSNGGLLVGAVVTQRPDLFRAAYCAVPLLDMLRYDRFLMGSYWVPEYGSSQDGRQVEYLIGYSPYHKVQEGVSYPAILFVTGERDARVPSLHAKKMAARLQKASASQQPVLLIVQKEAGHGKGKPYGLRLTEACDRLSFLMQQLGLGS